MDFGPGGPPDLSMVDLYGVDFSGVDFSIPGADAGLCDVVAQSGCGANEKCTLGAMDVNTCSSDGDKAPGAICGAASSDDCLKGSLCTQEATGLDQCRPFCNADTDCKQAAQGGVATNVGHCLVTLSMSTAKVCTIACQPVTKAGASGCATGLGCEVFGDTATTQATDCAKLGAGGDGADCTTNKTADCAPGSVCVGVTSGATTLYHCRLVCRSNTASDCPAGGYQCLAPTGVTTPAWGFCCPSGNC